MSKTVRERLSEALNEIDRPGSFYFSGSSPAVLPGLEIKGLGPIGLPLAPKQAKELIEHCHQAPYGKGEKTLVDRSVRRVWRLEPDHFTLTNPEWNRFIATTVSKVQEALGLEKQKLESHLYDLLLYEPKSFFLPHRDGEKLNRMVATLIIALPSTFEGGELVVRHDGREETIDFRKPDDNPFDIHFAAFYADCEHEVRPLRKGYRLALVYNLTLAKSKKSITAPRESEHVARIGKLLQDWAADDTARKLVITLNHQYTEAGLTWNALKGVDRTRAKILNEAARQAGCKAYLALLTLHESGAAEESGNGGRYSGRWGGYGGYGNGNADDYEMGEVFETELTAKSWSDSDGNPLPIGELRVEEDELLELDTEALRDVEPEEEFEGYTGNAGMTMDHWYRHASIVLWPERRHFEILCNGNGRNGVLELERMVTLLKRSKPGESKALKSQCLELAKAIFTTWPEQEFGWSYPGESKPPDLLNALGELGAPELISGFFRNLLTQDVTLEFGNSAATICGKYGWATFQDDLQAALESTSSQSLARNVRLLEQICSSKSGKKPGWGNLCTILAKTFVAALKRIDREPTKQDWRSRDVDRAVVLAGLVRSLILADQTALLSDVVKHILATPKRYPLTTTQKAALTSLRPWLVKNLKSSCAPLNNWLVSCRERLETLTAKQPAPPRTFRRAAKIACVCADCAELKLFLEDPHESVHRFRVRQDRRSHLETIIRNAHCDLDVVTDRRGSPQTLVCTKNLASFHEKTKTFRQDQTHLATLQAIEAELPK
ncbi:2OG-Fe(II) oxygenase [Singulisphaera sp. Ch08]|uniref:2OG-Fe(II) oxygenase n=1 Tax=Singulisphaera sp. Ch08 TaxID=3120278 RepID=A0AAU7CF37_9BACT